MINAFERRDRILNKPHLILLSVFGSETALVLILLRLFWFTPLLCLRDCSLRVDLTFIRNLGSCKIMILGDSLDSYLILLVLMVMGDWRGGSTEKRFRLQLCFLVPTANCHVWDWINFVRFLERREAPSRVGWTPSLFIRPGFPQKLCQFCMKPTLLLGHHLDNQRLNDDMRLYMSSLVMFGRGPEKHTEFDMLLANVHTDSTLVFVTSDWRSRMSLLPTWIKMLSNLRLALASSFRFDSMSPALAPGIQRTMVAGVENLTFRNTESPMTRLVFSAGVSLSGEKKER